MQLYDYFKVFVLLLKVTDTPGVCDTHRSKEDVHREIAKAVGTVTPGPHAVLMVVKADDRFTNEEAEAYEELKRLFGEEITKFMIVVFTGIDRLKGMPLADAVKKAPQKVQQVIADAQGRYIGFNNNDALPWSERQKQSDSLLQLVDQMMTQNGGQYYSNDLVKRVEKIIQSEIASGKTREATKEIIVHEKDRNLNRGLLRQVSEFLGNVCSVM